MSDFGPGRGDGLRLDAQKRVNYTLGMVLGEDEFRQEQHHLRSRDHLASRGLHGYGTVAGLGVSVADLQVTVDPGLAVDPAGRFICVSSTQCADLDAWLAANQEMVAAALGSLPGFPAPLGLHVLLCYRECGTDTVPVMVEPCRTGEESMVASRVAESFELRLAIEPQDDVGEVAGGRLEDAVEDLVRQPGSLPDGSLPENGPTVDEIRAGLRAWAVEQRPEVDAGSGCLEAAEDACVLLARLELEIDEADGALVVAGQPAVDDSDRPVLLSTRFLQAWLTRLAAAGGPGGPGQPGVTAHQDLDGLGGDDHQQYLLASGDRQLQGRLQAGNHRLTGVADATDPGDAVTLRQLDGVMRQGDAAGGDLTGSYPAPDVVRLQGVPVADADPNEEDSLVFAGGAWRPVPLFRRVLPFVTITRLTSVREFQLWFNLDAPRNGVEVVELTTQQVSVFRETPTPPQFVARIGVEGIQQQARNVFALVLQPGVERGLLRFRFALRSIQLASGDTVAEYAQRERIVFDGQTPGFDLTKFFPLTDKPQ
jgi:hypothetical protein